MADTPFIWRLEWVWIWKETTAWTSVSPTYWIPKVTWKVEPKLETKEDESWLWKIEDMSDMYTTMESTEFTADWIVRDDFIWLLLLAVFWKVTTVANADVSWNVYDHTFEVDENNNHKTLSIWGTNPYLDWQNKSIVAAYWTLDTFELTADAGDYVKFKVNAKWKKLTDWTKKTPAYNVSNAFTSKDVSVKIADTEAWLVWATPLKLKSVKINFNKNVEMIQNLGDVDVDTIHNKQFSLDGEFTSIYRDEDQINLVRNSSKKYMQITIKNTSTIIWTAEYPELTLTLYKAWFKEWSKTEDSNGLIEQTVWFKALLNTTDWKAVKAVLTNLITSY